MLLLSFTDKLRIDSKLIGILFNRFAYSVSLSINNSDSVITSGTTTSGSKI